MLGCLVVVFAVYNATNILNQWRHLALSSELPGANSSITSETFWAASTNHRAPDNQTQPRRPIRLKIWTKIRDRQMDRWTDKTRYRVDSQLKTNNFYFSSAAYYLQFTLLTPLWVFSLFLDRCLELLLAQPNGHKSIISAWNTEVTCV